MGRIVGIICEYNPFHKGHRYQVDQIRKENPDATIVAIMSGNIVQRGDFAMLDKYRRAEAALECGVNAVLELPFPYSGSTAEIFARAGVEIAYRIGCQSLYFGTEEHSLDDLEKIAVAIDSDEFENAIRDFLKEKKIGYIAAKEQALKAMGLCPLKRSNDILAVEYIRAIRHINCNLEYKTIRRIGAGYNDKQLCEIMSASAIRNRFYENGELVSVPQNALSIYEAAKSEGDFLDVDSAQRIVHVHALMCNSFLNVFDSSAEISTIIKNSALQSKTSEEFLNSLSSKVYTASRVKRVILYSIFGIKAINKTPEFTLLLGMDEKGRAFLGNSKKEAKIKIITKHADSKCLSETGRKQLEIVYKVDSVYNSLLTEQSSPNKAYKKKPIIK